MTGVKESGQLVVRCLAEYLIVPVLGLMIVVMIDFVRITSPGNLHQ